jgi:hypothetical protein
VASRLLREADEYVELVRALVPVGLRVTARRQRSSISRF